MSLTGSIHPIDKTLLTAILDGLSRNQGITGTIDRQLHLHQHASQQLARLVVKENAHLEAARLIIDAAIQRFDMTGKALARSGYGGSTEPVPYLELTKEAFWHRQIQAHEGEIIQMEQLLTSVDPGARTQFVEADATGKRRIQMALPQLIEHHIVSGLGLSHGRGLPLQLIGCHHALGGQPLHILELALLVMQIGFTFGHRRLLMRIIQADDALSLTHIHRLVGEHKGDTPGYFRHQSHRVIGLQHTGQLEGIANLPFLHGRQGHYGSFCTSRFHL